MERAGRIIGKLKFPQEAIDSEAMAKSAWPAAVGKKIAAKTRAMKVVRSTLVIECEDQVWQRQLNTLRGYILGNLENLLGTGVITNLDLRPMTPKRGMQTEVAARPFELGAVNDEADQIKDPVFRLLYKQSRRKAAAAAEQPALFELKKASA